MSLDESSLVWIMPYFNKHASVHVVSKVFTSFMGNASTKCNSARIKDHKIELLHTRARHPSLSKMYRMIDVRFASTFEFIMKLVCG